MNAVAFIQEIKSFLGMCLDIDREKWVKGK